jgi:5-methylcytosine-specific restriction endonuclease McrA
MRAKKTRNNNTMTEAGLKNFIISLLRKSNFSWKPKKETALKCRSDKKLVNLKTGKENMASKCEVCETLIFEKELKVDHIEPIVPVEGWGDTTEWLGVNWNEYLSRMFVESDGLQGICKPCHDIKTKQENKQRKDAKESKD